MSGVEAEAHHQAVEGSGVIYRGGLEVAVSSCKSWGKSTGGSWWWSRQTESRSGWSGQ
jgi:hypothetical protein